MSIGNAYNFSSILRRELIAASALGLAGYLGHISIYGSDLEDDRNVRTLNQVAFFSANIGVLGASAYSAYEIQSPGMVIFNTAMLFYSALSGHSYLNRESKGVGAFNKALAACIYGVNASASYTVYAIAICTAAQLAGLI